METAVSIQQPDAADYNWMATLCADQFYRVHETGFVNEDLHWLIDHKFNPLALQEDIETAENSYWVAFINQQPAGCVKLGPTSLSLAKQHPKAIELSRLYLFAHITGHGIGKLLLLTALAAAIKMGYTSCWLHVYIENPGARRFYEREGFTVVGTEQLLVKNSKPEGWVMMKTLV
jgi:diamine N-acetyltransferase